MEVRKEAIKIKIVRELMAKFYGKEMTPTKALQLFSAVRAGFEQTKIQVGLNNWTWASAS